MDTNISIILYNRMGMHNKNFFKKILVKINLAALPTVNPIRAPKHQCTGSQTLVGLRIIWVDC